MILGTRTALVIAACLLPLALPAVALAQKPGDKIEYLAESWPVEKWVEGVFVRNAKNATQVIIREAPSEFEPAGFQRAYDRDRIRPLAAPVPIAAVPNLPGIPAALPMPGELPAPVPVPAALPMPIPMPEALPMPQALPMPMPGPAAIPAAMPAGPVDLKEGDPVEYRAQTWPKEIWEVGTYVRKAGNATQVVIREKPTEFYPRGFQRAYSIEDVRPIRKPGGDDAAAGCGDETTGAAQAPPIVAASGLMSEDDVLSFLRTRFGDVNPFRHPRREQFMTELRAEVLRRGVNFRYETLGRFSNELSKFGALSNVTAPLALNFGPPAKLQDLYGRWLMLKVGVAVPKERGGKLYAGSVLVGDAGAIVINPDRTYVWHATNPPIRGQWRPATPDEMAKSDKGGDGIVVVNGKSNDSWLIFTRNEGGPEGEGIKITDLGTRNLRERGTRK